MNSRKGDLAIWQETDGAYHVGMVGSTSRDGKRVTSLLHRQDDIRWREGWEGAPTVVATVPADTINVGAFLHWQTREGVRWESLEDIRVMLARFMRKSG